MLEKETQKHIRLENLLRMLSESSFIESSIFDLESGFSIVESGFLKRESEHESGFFPSPDFLRVRVQVRVRVRSGFRSMPAHTHRHYFLTQKRKNIESIHLFVLTYLFASESLYLAESVALKCVACQ